MPRHLLKARIPKKIGTYGSAKGASLVAYALTRQRLPSGIEAEDPYFIRNYSPLNRWRYASGSSNSLALIADTEGAIFETTEDGVRLIYEVVGRLPSNPTGYASYVSVRTLWTHTKREPAPASVPAVLNDDTPIDWYVLPPCEWGKLDDLNDGDYFICSRDFHRMYMMMGSPIKKSGGSHYWKYIDADKVTKTQTRGYGQGNRWVIKPRLKPEQKRPANYFKTSLPLASILARLRTSIKKL